MKVEDKINELGLSLLPVVKPVANYIPAVRTGNLVFSTPHKKGT